MERDRLRLSLWLKRQPSSSPTSKDEDAQSCGYFTSLVEVNALNIDE